MQMSGIYKITNWINGKFYIGSAINFERRWREHKKELKGNRHRNSRLQHSYNKYGKNNFVFETLEIINDTTKLLEREQYWLDLTKCYNDTIGYNINKIAESSLGLKRSLETRQKQRLSKLGKKQSAEHIASRVQKIKDHKVPQHAKDALSKRSLGNTWGLGYKQTDDVKAKISATHKGKPKSEEHKRKISETLKKKNQLILTQAVVMIL